MMILMKKNGMGMGCGIVKNLIMKLNKQKMTVHILVLNFQKKK